MKLLQLNARQFRDEETGWFLDTRSRFHLTFMDGNRTGHVSKEGGRDDEGNPAMIVLVAGATWFGNQQADQDLASTEKDYIADFLEEVTRSGFDNYIVRR